MAELRGTHRYHPLNARLAPSFVCFRSLDPKVFKSRGFYPPRAASGAGEVGRRPGGEYPVSHEARVILRASEHIQVLLPDTGAKIRAILERGQALYERIPQESPVFTHSDFKADHLWITPASLMLIDFETCSRTDAAIDVGKFLADLQWWYSLYEKPGLQQAQNCFLNSYTPGVPQERLLRARLYEVLILTKTIIRRVPIFDRHWASRTSSWIDRAESLLCALEAQWAK